MPMVWATGYSNGARITMLGVVSMNMPGEDEDHQHDQDERTGSLVIEVSSRTNVCGTSSTVSACANRIATAMIGQDHAVDAGGRLQHGRKVLRRMVRCASPTISATATATAADSVGVNTPE